MSPSQYFEQEPSVVSDEREVVLALPDLTLRLRTDRGVFSHGAVDAGTKYLLLEAPPPPASGHLLDLGCGAGPIACALAARSPAATVWAVDVNERALALTAANARANGLGNVRAVRPGEVPGDVRFTGVWSNPPIRIGKAALHELLTTWLARLGPGAHALLVVQKHLGADSLVRWLAAEGWVATRLGSRQAYRLLDVAAP